MTARFTLLPDPRFDALAAPLAQRMRDAAGAIEWQTFPDVLDPLMRSVLDTALSAAGADEGTIWLVERSGEALVPAYNTGPNAAAFVGSFRQPLTHGLISMVFATQQLFCDNQVYRNELQDKGLDQMLGLVTCAMIAVPFFYARESRGVLSCVQLRRQGSEAAERSGFAPNALRQIQRVAAVLGRLIDHYLLGTTVGWVER